LTISAYTAILTAVILSWQMFLVPMFRAQSASHQSTDYEKSSVIFAIGEELTVQEVLN
jgi:hypothetical protein